MKNRSDFIIKVSILGYLILLLGGCGYSGPHQNNASEATTDERILTESTTNSSANTEDISKREEKFSEIQMVNSKEGWARSPQAVFKTENGGTDWIDITPVDIKAIKFQYSIQEFFFLDENCAWIMPYQETQTKYVSRTIIYRTLDKGVHWDRFELPQTSMRPALFFADKNTGWMTIQQSWGLGQHPFDLYTTKDGGKTVIVNKKVPKKAEKIPHFLLQKI